MVIGKEFKYSIDEEISARQWILIGISIKRIYLMFSFFSTRKAFCLISLVGMIIILTACTGDTSSTEPGNSPGASTTATVTALIKEMTSVGTPTVKAGTGTTFEVDGQVKNGDSHQHDIYVKATLLNAAGNVIGTATVNVDDVAGNTTEPFAIQVTVTEPTWKSVQVSIATVTENINGSGTD